MKNYYSSELEEEEKEQFRMDAEIGESELKNIQNIVRIEVYELYVLASLLKEKYEEELELISHNNKFMTRYFPDIRLLNNGEGLYIYWQDFIKRNTALRDIPFDRRKTIYGRVVRMPKKGYSAKNFKGTHASETQRILFYEQLFEQIRKRTKALKKIDYYLLQALKLDLDSSYESLVGFIV